MKILYRCCLAAGFYAASGLAAQDVSREKPVELPTYTVVDKRDLPPPEPWSYARIPGFEVLSNASDKSTKRLLQDFGRFYVALSLVWPGVQRPSATPAALIICGRGAKFDKFRPAGENSIDRGAVSFTVRDREQAAIVVDFQTKVLNLATPEGAATATVADDGTTSGASGDPGIEVDSHRQLYREYIRFLLASVEPRGPAWFEEGVAQIFMAMDVTRTEITVGKLEDPNTISVEAAFATETGTTTNAPAQDRDFNAALAHRGLLPMGDLLAVAHDSPEALNPVGGTWAKQCYAFVHWALYGNNGSHQKGFITFLARLAKEPLSEALFKDCFKKSYKDMGFDLRSYIEMTDHTIAGVRAGKGEKLPDAPPVELREATEAEIGRITGDTLRLTGHAAAARAALTAPYIRGQRDPALLAAIGLLERVDGDEARARKFLEAAVHEKVQRPRAYLELARMRFAEGPDRFTPEQTIAVLTPLFSTRSQRPPLPEVYELIAETWARSAVTPGPDHLAVLDEGIRFFPKDHALVYATAVQKIRAGLLPDAKALISRGLRVAPDVAARTKFETLQASLPAGK
jgi:hypothetical protein